jgi:hypothetical protein
MQKQNKKLPKRYNAKSHNGNPNAFSLLSHRLGKKV